MNDNPIYKAIKAVAVAVFNIKTKIGEDPLETSAKTVSGAINELANKGVNMEIINAAIQGKINELIGGASTAYDTLKEIEDALVSGKSVSSALLNELSDVKTKLNELKSAQESIADLPERIESILNTGVKK